MILQINKMYTPDIGGIETVVEDYANYLKEYDNVTVLCISKRFSLKTKIEMINGITVYRCSSFGTYLSMPVSFSFFYYMYKLSRKSSTIHIHEPFPLASLAWFLIPKKVRLFVSWHSDIVKYKNIKVIFEYFQKKLLSSANVIISTSDRMIEYSEILTKYKDKTIVIPLGIDIETYLMDISPCDKILIDLPKEYVLFIGRLVPYKGMLIFLDAIEQIDLNIPFVIVGNGLLSSRIKEHIAKSRKNIYFINRFVTDSEKKCLLKYSKFMVFPSIYPSEAFGIMQLESMVYGKPVINTFLPTGVPWVSKHNISGLTVAVKDSLELSIAIETLYKNNILYNNLSDGAIDRISNNFDILSINKSIKKLYLL
jgi:rhamnosyl/mannosyltransferase